MFRALVGIERETNDGDMVSAALHEIGVFDTEEEALQAAAAEMACNPIVISATAQPVQTQN